MLNGFKVIVNVIVLAPTDLSITKARSEVVDFLEPFTEYYSGIFIRNPVGSYNFEAYLDPLSILTWMVISVLFLLSPILLYVSVRYFARYIVPLHLQQRSLLFLCIDLEDQNLIMMILPLPNATSSLPMPWLQKAGVIHLVMMLPRVPLSGNPKSIFGLDVTMTNALRYSLLLGCMIFYKFWEAMLVSYLAVQVTVYPFTSIETMVQKTNYKLAMQPGGTYEDTFRYSTNPIWQEAFRTRLEPYIPMYKEFQGNLLDFALNGQQYAVWGDAFTYRFQSYLN